VTDGEGNTTLLSYDAQNRVLTEHFADVPGQDASIVTHIYNAVHELGRFSTVSEGMRFYYDVRGQLRQTHHQATVTDDGQPFESRSYDAAGRLVQTHRYSAAGSILAATAMSYDAQSRVQSETSAGQTHHYHYDLAGNLTLFQPGTGRQISRQFDALNRLTHLTDADRVTQIGYDRAGRAATQTSANETKQRNLYDAQGRLVQRRLLNLQGAAMAEFHWRHDAHGNVIRQSETWHPSGNDVVGTSQTKLMEYDSADRLVGELTQPAAAGAPVKQVVHGFDDADNRVTQSEYADAVLTKATSYAYNARNQLEEWTVVESGLRTQRVLHTYDRRGRCLQKTYLGATDSVEVKVVGFQFNAQDELTQATLSQGQVWHEAYRRTEINYQYDYRHRRLERDCSRAAVTQNGPPPPGQPAHEKLLTSYSGGLSVADYATTVPGGSIYSTQPEAEYVRGPDMGGGVGGMLYTSRKADAGSLPPAPSPLRFSLSNGRGDIVAQSDAQARVTWAASYEAYGKRTHEAGENKDRQRANTKDEETEFGILNEGFRYRDLDTGVWLTRDPAGFVDGPNLYAYVQQNPWSKFDPKGLYNFFLHRSMTELGALSEYGSAFVTNLQSGVLIPDMPEGYSTYTRMKEKGTLSYRTHHGDLQGWHFMGNAGEETAKDVQKKAIDFVMLHVSIYRGAEPTMSKNDREAHLGVALHPVQDSFSRAHTKRNATTSVIEKIFDYNTQDVDLHKQLDSNRLNREYKMGIEATRNFLDAVVHGVELPDGEKSKDLTVLRGFLENEIFPLAPNAEIVPSGVKKSEKMDESGEKKKKRD